MQIFPDLLKNMQELFLYIKGVINQSQEIIDRFLFYLLYQINSKNTCVVVFKTIYKNMIYYTKINLVFEKIIPAKQQ